MAPATTQKSNALTHDKRLLLFVVASLLLANIAQWAICRALGLGNPGGLKDLVLAFTHITQWTDSWRPMMTSLDAFQANPSQPIYAAKLYDTLIYPLASLLPMVFLRKLGLSDGAMLRVLAWASWLAVLGIVAMSIALARRLLRERETTLTWPSTLAIMLAVLGCYPLLKGYALGNAQTFLSLGFIVMLYLWTDGHERSAGVVAALLTMVKPQFVLLLLWMAVRRRWGAMWAFVACAAVVIGVSIAVFGWHNNLDYIAVLAGLSHKAQSHFANQSMFGTINRMIFNGENIGYTPYVYTPYIPWVYKATVASSVLLMLAVLVYPWRKMSGSAADLGAMGIISVAASPMAWEHHYGIVFSIAAWAWFAHACWWRKRPWVLGVAVFLCLNFLPAFNYLSDKRGWNILQSYLYFGALLLVGWLMRLSRSTEREEDALAA